MKRKIPNTTPDSGDIVWIDMDPQSGHEQKGRRPALVLTKLSYNKRTGLAILCPITSISKGYPFEVVVKEKTISGVALADQIKSLDFKTRNAEIIEKVNKATLKEIIEIAKELLEG